MPTPRTGSLPSSADKSDVPRAVEPGRLGCELDGTGSAITCSQYAPTNRRSGTLPSSSNVGLRYRSSMPAAEVTIPVSLQAATGRSAIAAGRGGLRRLSDRKANTALSLALLGPLFILGGCSATTTSSPATSTARSMSSPCVRKAPTLTPVIGSTLSTLPPSHDNDVGRRRLPDSYPDADQDANQVPQVGRCRES